MCLIFIRLSAEDGPDWQLNSLLDVQMTLDHVDGFEEQLHHVTVKVPVLVRQLLTQTHKAAQLAYESDTIIRGFLQRWQLAGRKAFALLEQPESLKHPTQVTQGVKVDTNFFLAKNEDQTAGGQALILSFRGTEGLSLTDWATDFTFNFRKSAGKLLFKPPLTALRARFKRP